MTAPRSVRLVVHGRVQGVGYRAWLAGEARRHGVRGWMRNRNDGTVEALVLADAATLDALVAACRRGPPAAIVREIDLVEDGTPVSEGFKVLPTV